jgi:hypothetical protein
VGWAGQVITIRIFVGRQPYHFTCQTGGVETEKRSKLVFWELLRKLRCLRISKLPSPARELMGAQLELRETDLCNFNEAKQRNLGAAGLRASGTSDDRQTLRPLRSRQRKWEISGGKQLEQRSFWKST